MKKSMSVKKLFGLSMKGILALIVFAYLGLQSLNFFLFTFPADQWYLAWLGLGLTGGAVVAYLIILMTDADTPLKKYIAIAMLVICALGEVVTAGFGIQVEAWQKAGLTLDGDSFRAMVLAVRGLGLFHALALIMYFAGDVIFKAFQDDDGDGIPNFADPVDNRKQSAPTPQPIPMAQNVPQAHLQNNNGNGSNPP